MPELGPYGSMRGEVREDLPYRDNGTKNRPYEIKGLRAPKVSLAASSSWLRKPRVTSAAHITAA
jgi:hypothetical protein